MKIQISSRNEVLTQKQADATYVGDHGQSKKETDNANNYSNFSAVRQQLLFPVVDNSSDQ